MSCATLSHISEQSSPAAMASSMLTFDFVLSPNSLRGLTTKKSIHRNGVRSRVCVCVCEFMCVHMYMRYVCACMWRPEVTARCLP